MSKIKMVKRILLKIRRDFNDSVTFSLDRKHTK